MTTAVPPLAGHREDLDPRRGECLVCYVDRMLARGDCSGGLALSGWWRDLTAPRATTLESRLGAVGARCDCEVVTIAYEPLPSLTPRRAGLWDRPACAGVRRGSTQPCRSWRLRRRWAHASPPVGRTYATASKAAG